MMYVGLLFPLVVINELAYNGSSHMYHTHVAIILSILVIIINWRFKFEDEDLDLLAVMHVIKSENIELTDDDPIMKNEKLKMLWDGMKKENYSYDFNVSSSFADNILEIDEITALCSSKKSDNESHTTKTEDTEGIILHVQNDKRIDNNYLLEHELLPFDEDMRLAIKEQ